MANKITKKGKNPAAIDNWLDSLGLYRKNVAYDETCLFRAVSEQLFDCQIYHERIRKECLIFARHKYAEFRKHVNSEEQWHEHLDLLEKHMVVCGNIELDIISRRYNRDIIVFDGAHQQVIDVTKLILPNPLLLCLMDEDHYDVVYKKEYIETAGFCQSIIYKILYEDVFKIPNVDDIVKAMLYDKNHLLPQLDLSPDGKITEINNNDPIPSTSTDELAEDIPRLTLFSTNIAPFPFKVAKALDPTIYRNIEYDSWGEVRREMRLGDWYYGDDKLILGTRCILNDSRRNETYECYIQEIIKAQNKCVVYLTHLAEKRLVNYTDLSPESDAKPWPLPYRFSKNLVISNSPQLPPTDKVPKAIKKRNKEKRRTKSCSESSALTTIPATSEAIENVNAYVGIPLQMQNPVESNYHHQEAPAEPQVDSNSRENTVMVPDMPNTPNRYQWEPSHWQPYMPPTPDPFVWPPPPTTPQNVFNFNLKPMVASAPVTPDVVPYHDPNFPYYLNYHVDMYHPPYPQWSTPQPGEVPTTPQKIEPDKHPEDGNKPQTSQTELPSHQYTPPEIFDQPPPTTVPERPTLCTNLTPQNPSVEVYSPMIPIPPGTPVIYAPTPPDITEMMMPPPSIMYTPPVDMQYVSPGPFVYPPTPPAAWYPPGVNSHGFIFPPPRQ